MIGQRFMSVINISDMDATTKFQEVNKKVRKSNVVDFGAIALFTNHLLFSKEHHVLHSHMVSSF